MKWVNGAANTKSMQIETRQMRKAGLVYVSLCIASKALVALKKTGFRECRKKNSNNNSAHIRCVFLNQSIPKLAS